MALKHGQIWEFLVHMVKNSHVKLKLIQKEVKFGMMWILVSLILVMEMHKSMKLL